MSTLFSSYFRTTANHFPEKNNQWDVSFVDNSISCWSYQLNLNLIISIESKFKEIVHSQLQWKVYAYDKFAVKLMAINNSAEKLKRVIMHDWISYLISYTISFDLHVQLWRNRQNFYWTCEINNQVIHDTLLMFRASESSYIRKDKFIFNFQFKWLTYQGLRGNPS